MQKNKDKETTPRALAAGVRCGWRTGAVLSAAVLLAAPAAWAQGGVEPGTMMMAAASQEPARDESATVILPALQGLQFLSGFDQVRPGGVEVSGLDVSAVPILDTPAFHELAGRYLGERLSLGDLQRLVEEVVVFCREHDRPVVDVLVPEQDVTTGAVQVVVLEGRLGTVSSINNRWFSSGFLTSSIRLQGGQPVSARTLQEDLDWLNRNPFRQVDAVFVPGKEPGTTDVQLQVQERFPVRVYASYENSGNRIIGKDMWSAGFNWGNVFDTDHQAGYQYDRSGRGGALEAHHLSYTAPLQSRHILSFSASFIETDSDIFGAFGLTGRSTRVGARYWLSLPSSSETLAHGIQGGIDYKRTNNNLDFFGTQIVDDTADIVQLVAQYAGSMPDARGLNSWYADLVLSPGGITGDNEDENFDAIREGAEAAYGYVRAGYERLTRLPRGYTWVFSGDLQYASARLLASEQMGIGGSGSVRGFEEREASGDHGVLLSNELRSPGYRPDGESWFRRNSELQGLVFFDWGMARTQDPLAGESGTESLAGVGLGLRYRLGNNLVAQADYGWQMAGKDIDPEDDSRAHVRILASY